MQSITFAVPTLTTAEMVKQDQIDILTNQATAAVVCCYLEHMNVAINKGIGVATATSSAANFFTQPKLVSLINDVQTALRTVP